MKAVIQRVTSACLKVNGETISETGKGLVVYLGVMIGDTEKDGDEIVRKIANMRIFEDENGKMNLSPLMIGGEILFVSQFTLAGDCRKGNRPSFTEAENPVRANELYEYSASALAQTGLVVKKGVFGADMKINQHCDGPVTIIYDTRNK
ncbi:MAG: D-tyrosyl-tRNA(Tyr) deacylase [Clostridia bacterium]|nr:D-tyrosyl-tRNA(Tyr) deacylase [Clostridia bacterium]